RKRGQLFYSVEVGHLFEPREMESVPKFPAAPIRKKKKKIRDEDVGKNLWNWLTPNHRFFQATRDEFIRAVLDKDLSGYYAWTVSDHPAAEKARKAFPLPIDELELSLSKAIQKGNNYIDQSRVKKDQLFVSMMIKNLLKEAPEQIEISPARKMLDEESARVIDPALLKSEKRKLESHFYAITSQEKPDPGKSYIRSTNKGREEQDRPSNGPLYKASLDQYLKYALEGKPHDYYVWLLSQNQNAKRLRAKHPVILEMMDQSFEKDFPQPLKFIKLKDRQEGSAMKSMGAYELAKVVLKKVEPQNLWKAIPRERGGMFKETLRHFIQKGDVPSGKKQRREWFEQFDIADLDVAESLYQKIMADIEKKRDAEREAYQESLRESVKAFILRNTMDPTLSDPESLFPFFMNDRVHPSFDPERRKKSIRYADLKKQMRSFPKAREYHEEMRMMFM
ncbi:MAG: hypothetical protein AAGM67_11190, partial [Bacteroidota bacterium]